MSAYESLEEILGRKVTKRSSRLNADYSALAGTHKEEMKSDDAKSFLELIAELSRRCNQDAFRFTVWNLVARFAVRLQTEIKRHEASALPIVGVSVHWRSSAWSTWYRFPWVLDKVGESRYLVPAWKRVLAGLLFDGLPEYLADPPEKARDALDEYFGRTWLLRLSRNLQECSLVVCPVEKRSKEKSARNLDIEGFDPLGYLREENDPSEALLNELRKVFFRKTSESTNADVRIYQDSILLSLYFVLYGALHQEEKASHSVLLVPALNPLSKNRPVGLAAFSFKNAFDRATARGPKGRVDSDSPTPEEEKELLSEVASEAKKLFDVLWAIDRVAAAESAGGGISVVHSLPDLPTILRAMAFRKRKQMAPHKRFNYALAQVLYDVIPEAWRDSSSRPRLPSRLKSLGLSPIMRCDRRSAERAVDAVKNLGRSGEEALGKWAVEFKTKRGKRGSYPRFTGASPRYLGFLERLVAHVRSGEPKTVFLYGEPGTGKDFLAQILHLSYWLHRLASDKKARGRKPFPRARRDQSYFTIHCGALSPDEKQFQRLLFGASRKKRGPYAKAAEKKGTLFLDEFNTMPDPRRADLLLRALDPGEIVYADGTKDDDLENQKPLLVIASNVPAARLHELDFNQAVISRLTEHEEEVPPLRARKEDILLLLDMALKKPKDKGGLGSRGDVRVDQRALRLLVELPWPGNARDLMAVLRKLVSMRRVRGQKTGDIGFEEVLEAVSRRLGAVPSAPVGQQLGSIGSRA